MYFTCSVFRRVALCSRWFMLSSLIHSHLLQNKKQAHHCHMHLQLTGSQHYSLHTQKAANIVYMRYFASYLISKIQITHLSCCWCVLQTTTWTKVRCNCKHTIKIWVSTLSVHGKIVLNKKGSIPSSATTAELLPLLAQLLEHLQQPEAQRHNTLNTLY